MLLSLMKKQLLKLRKYLILLCLGFISSCAMPIGNPWTDVSSGTIPDPTPMAQVVPQNGFGERAPADNYVAHNDVGESFASSMPPGYPQPLEQFLPEHVFSGESLSEENAQTASTMSGQIPPSQDFEQFESVESFVDPVEDWLIQEGATLKQILGDWSDRAGWRLVWKSKRDFKIEAGAMLRGRYVDVSSAIIRNMARAKPAPIATYFRGNRVLLIETLEDENAY